MINHYQHIYFCLQKCLLLSKKTMPKGLFEQAIVKKLQSGKSYWGERLSTVDLLVLTSLDQLVFVLLYWKYYLQNKLP